MGEPNSIPKTERERKASDAFEAHAALLCLERENPALIDNPVWTMIRQDAYERFVIAFEAMK